MNKDEQDLADAIEKMQGGKVERINPSTMLRFRVYRIFHMFGIHTWVQTMQKTETGIYYDGMRCYFCGMRNG